MSLEIKVSSDNFKNFNQSGKNQYMFSIKDDIRYEDMFLLRKIEIICPCYFGILPLLIKLAKVEMLRILKIN